jgi:hypothetical protein
MSLVNDVKNAFTGDVQSLNWNKIRNLEHLAIFASNIIDNRSTFLCFLAHILTQKSVFAALCSSEAHYHLELFFLKRKGISSDTSFESANVVRPDKNRPVSGFFTKIAYFQV